jgi:hypothetical protein
MKNTIYYENLQSERIKELQQCKNELLETQKQLGAQ